MSWAREEAGRHGYREVTVNVRLQLPGNRAFYERLGYRVVAEHPHPLDPRGRTYEMRLQVRPASPGGRAASSGTSGTGPARRR